MKVTLKTLDEWMFRGLGGIVTMIRTRTMLDRGFSRLCKQMLDSDLKRLEEVRCEVDARQVEETPGEITFDLLDIWFVRCYIGINKWLDLRSREGPPMSSQVINDLENHITQMREIVDRERARRDQHHADAPS